MNEPQPSQIDKRQVRLAFERSAASYDTVAVFQREVAKRMLERLELIRIKPETVLDVGCGTGQVARALLRRYRRSRVVALDVALAMVRKAAAGSRWSRKPLPVCGDAESLPLADESINLVFSNLALHWCNDLERVLHELRRVLAPNGLLLMTTLGLDTLKELRASWAQADHHVHVNRFFDMHEIGDAVLRAGFADPVIDMEMMCLTYADVAQLMRELKLLGAHNSTHGRPRGLTGKGRLHRLRQAYERFRTVDGVLPASFEVIHGLAWAGPGRQPRRNIASARREASIPIGSIQRPGRWAR